MTRRSLSMFLSALLWSSCAAVAHGQVHYKLGMSADYRQARFDWNIAGDFSGQNPNVLSELTWYDLEIAQLSATAEVEAGEHLLLQAYGDYGNISSGKNQDSDYGGDNRTLEFSRSNNEGSGTVSDASIALGYRLKVYDSSVGHYGYITPMMGYSRHRQYLRIKNGVQTIPDDGPFPGLDSHYDAQWYGPWLGVNMQLDADKRTALIIDLQYHWADYSAQADWNLSTSRPHPIGFEHNAKGNGVVASLALSHVLNKHWSMSLCLEAQNWQTDPGLDTDYHITNPTTKTVEVLYTRLNVVHWESRTLGLAATYRF